MPTTEEWGKAAKIACLPTSIPTNTTYLFPRPPYSESAVRPFDTSTFPQREVTIGLELEMVILDLHLSSDPFEILCETFQSMYYRGLIAAQAERYGPEIGKAPDRKRFLVMNDDSIDGRVQRVKPGVPGTPFTGIDNWEETLAEQCAYEKGAADTSVPKDDISDFVIFLQDFAALNPLEFWSVACRKSTLRESSPDESASSSDSDNPWASDWDHLSFSSCSELSSRPQSPVEFLAPDQDQWIRGSPIEVCTPIMTHGSWRWIIPVVFEHLATRLKLHFNHTTGLHVHIGCGVDRHWSLLELKKIAKAVIIFETVLDHVHPPFRSHTLSWAIQSTRYTPALADLSTLDAIRKIGSTETLQDFLAIVGPEKFHKYNFACNESYGTVEFRQAEAHSDGKKAVAWIELAAKFVTAAIQTTEAEFDMWAAAIQLPAHTVRLGEEVWSRFGIPWNELCPKVLANVDIDFGTLVLGQLDKDKNEMKEKKHEDEPEQTEYQEEMKRNAKGSFSSGLERFLRIGSPDLIDIFATIGGMHGSDASGKCF